MFLTGLSLIIGLQAASQPSGSEEIVVTGQRLTRETATQYVSAITRPVKGQLPTFRNPVCPSVIGMPAEHAGTVVARIRKVAQHVKIKVAPAGCATNLHVIVVDDAKQFVSELKRQKPAFFARMENSEVARLLRQEGPAIAWNSTQIQNEDGQVYADNASGKSAFDRMQKNRVSSGSDSLGAVENVPRGGDGASGMRTMSASIIKSTTRQSTLDSYVVIDTAAANGKTPMQLADYVTMRSLGGAQPPAGDMAVGTILKLFSSGSEVPPSVTASDVAYLKALYSGPATLSDIKQVNRLSAAVLKASLEQK